jgi:hypothetical protein
LKPWPSELFCWPVTEVNPNTYFAGEFTAG